MFAALKTVARSLDNLASFAEVRTERWLEEEKEDALVASKERLFERRKREARINAKLLKLGIK